MSCSCNCEVVFRATPLFPLSPRLLPGPGLRLISLLSNNEVRTRKAVLSISYVEEWCIVWRMGNTKFELFTSRPVAKINRTKLRRRSYQAIDRILPSELSIFRKVVFSIVDRTYD